MPTLEQLLFASPKCIVRDCDFGEIVSIEFPAEIDCHDSWHKADCYSLECTDADGERYKLLFAVVADVIIYLGDI